METEDMLDWMLEEAKKKPMDIHHDFDTRFRVWVDQIIPSRIDAIRQCGGDVDYAMRMVKLTNADGARLLTRLEMEYEYMTEDHGPQCLIDVCGVAGALVNANAAYLDEVKL